MAYRLSYRRMDEDVFTDHGLYHVSERKREATIRGFRVPVLLDVVRRDDEMAFIGFVTSDAGVFLLEQKRAALPSTWHTHDKPKLESVVRDFYTRDDFLVGEAPFSRMVDELRGRVLREAYTLAGDNQSLAGHLLGLSRTGFQYQWAHYGSVGFSKSKRRSFTLPLTSYQDLIESFERQLFEQAWKEAGGDSRRAAQILRMPRSTFSDRLKKLGVGA